MKWQRFIWTVTLLIIWVISLMIVDSTAKQTRMGYQKQKLLKMQRELNEKNLRLKCEISTLNNLVSAETYSEQENLVFPDGDQVVIINNSKEKELTEN